MDDVEYYLREIDEEIYQSEIQERRKAEKNIAYLLKCIKLYNSLKEENLEQAKQLVTRCIENAYERARLHYKEITENNFSTDFSELYGLEYERTIKKAQKTLFPELFNDHKI